MANRDSEFLCIVKDLAPSLHQELVVASRPILNTRGQCDEVFAASVSVSVL